MFLSEGEFFNSHAWLRQLCAEFAYLGYAINTVWFVYSKVLRLMREVRDGGKHYNPDVRYYTTKPMNGGTTFKCSYCEHSVTTLDFNSTNGNCRTQAAAVINEHAAILHSRPTRALYSDCVKPGVYGENNIAPSAWPSRMVPPFTRKES
jgi:hypothetical protein